MKEECTADAVFREVADYCTRHGMFQGDRVLVALSGGGDSVALLDMLVRLREEFGIDVHAAHINHGIRGQAAEHDEQFCRDLCESWNVPLTVERIPEGMLAGQNESLETAAREERLKILANMAETVDAQKIATGHTLSDQAETVLQRIIRGTGPAGLVGILPVRDDIWIRPLLGIDRATVRAYLKIRACAFCNDETNDDPAFTRNRIRNRLVPLLREQFSEAAEQTIARLADLSRTQEEWIKTQVECAFRACLTYMGAGKILLDKREVLGYHTMIQQRLIRHCRLLLEGPGYDDDARTNELVRALFEQPEGKHTISAVLLCEVYEQNIVFTGSAEPYGPIPVTVPGDTSLPNGLGNITASHAPQNQTNSAAPHVCIPGHLIDAYGPLNTGSVRAGETIVLPDHQSPEKIRTLFSAAGLPTSLRTTIPVVRAGAVALWIPWVALARDVIPAPGICPEKPGNIMLSYCNGIVWRK